MQHTLLYRHANRAIAKMIERVEADAEESFFVWPRSYYVDDQPSEGASLVVSQDTVYALRQTAAGFECRADFQYRLTLIQPGTGWVLKSDEPGEVFPDGVGANSALGQQSLRTVHIRVESEALVAILRRDPQRGIVIVYVA